MVTTRLHVRLGRPVAGTFGLAVMLIALGTLLSGCSQSGSRSPRKLLDGLWSPDSARSANSSSFSETATVPIEPRDHTVEDLLSVARLNEHRGQAD